MSDPDADSLYYPVSVRLDAANNLYVADSQNMRVLMFLPGSTTVTQVLGQGGSFTTSSSGRSIT